MDTSLGDALRTYHGSTPLPSISNYLLNQKLVLPGHHRRGFQTSREAGYGKSFPFEIWVAVGFIWKNSGAYLTSSISRVRWKMREKLERYLGVTAVSSNLA